MNPPVPFCRLSVLLVAQQQNRAMLAVPAGKGPAGLTVQEERGCAGTACRQVGLSTPGHGAACSPSVCPRARGFPPAGDICRSALPSAPAGSGWFSSDLIKAARSISGYRVCQVLIGQPSWQRHFFVYIQGCAVLGIAFPPDLSFWRCVHYSQLTRDKLCHSS